MMINVHTETNGEHALYDTTRESKVFLPGNAEFLVQEIAEIATERT